MRLEHHSHSDPLTHPTRRFIDGRPVSMEAYWDAYDAYEATSPTCDITRSTVERDLPGGQRSRVVATTLN